MFQSLIFSYFSYTFMITVKLYICSDFVVNVEVAMLKDSEIHRIRVKIKR